ncbi:MAG: hypothetical protein FH751_16325 [Firmicutes bacterium]|nr:hypothetical protein [Bacillota bacterium]
MDYLMTQFKSIINLYFVFLVIAIGLFTFFVDGTELKKKKLKKEAIIAKIIGAIYVIIGPAFYILIKFM